MPFSKVIVLLRSFLIQQVCQKTQRHKLPDPAISRGLTRMRLCLECLGKDSLASKERCRGNLSSHGSVQPAEPRLFSSLSLYLCVVTYMVPSFCVNLDTSWRKFRNWTLWRTSALKHYDSKEPMTMMTTMRGTQIQEGPVVIPILYILYYYLCCLMFRIFHHVGSFPHDSPSS